MNPLRFLLPCSLLACAHPTTGVQGGSLVAYAKFPARPDRVYVPEGCKQQDGAPVRIPDGVEYELRVEKPGRKGAPPAPLFIEHMLNEPEVRLIKNTWSEGGAQHYFVWLPGSRGFEYVIPEDRKAPALRRVYHRPQLHRVKGAGGSATRPLNPPDIICQLTAQ